MNAQIAHLQINVSHFEVSKKFYSELFKILGWKKFIDEKDFIGWTNNKESIFLNQAEPKFAANKFHRKNVGLNHIAFKVNSKDEVDKFFNEFLLNKEEIVLYGGAKEYPEYCEGYYAVFFEDPDRIKLEINYYPD